MARTAPVAIRDAAGERDRLDRMARNLVRQIYLKYRPACTAPAPAIERVVELLRTQRDKLPPYTPVADDYLVTTWEREGGWEHEFQRQERLRALDEPELRDDRRLEDALQLVRENREIVERLRDKLSLEEAGPADFQRWKFAQDALASAQKRLDEVEAKVRARLTDQGSDVEYSPEYQKLLGELMEAYGDKGVQYRVLVRTLAAAEVKLRAVQRAGSESESFVELTKLVVSISNQIQKYTEAQKTQAIDEKVQEGMVAVLNIVERHLQGFPNVWKAIAQEVAAAVGEPEAVAS